MSEDRQQKALVDAHSAEAVADSGPYGPGDEWSAWELPVLVGALTRDQGAVLLVPLGLCLLGQMAVQSSLWLLPVAWIASGVAGLVMIQIALHGAVSSERVSLAACWERIKERLGTLLLSQALVGAIYGGFVLVLSVLAGVLAVSAGPAFLPVVIPLVAVFATAIMTFTSVSVLSSDDGVLDSVRRSLAVFRSRLLGNLMIFIAVAAASNGLILLIARMETFAPKLVAVLATSLVAILGAWVDASITSLRYHQLRSSQNAVLGLPPPQHRVAGLAPVAAVPLEERASGGTRESDPSEV